MKSSQLQLTFRKTAACPASSTLLSYRAEKLSRKNTAVVQTHLADCEFCSAELPLLAHHKPDRRQPRAPEMPINLRILAEAILFQKS